MNEKQNEEATENTANFGTRGCDGSEGDKIRFKNGSTFTIFSMLENTPLHGQLFQMTDDLTGELFTEPVEYLKHVEFIPNPTVDGRTGNGGMK